ncbi:MAG: DUF2891 domain-containing protein [Steroidobacteraceae bacterium]
MNSPITLGADRAEQFARIALGHVGREYPNKLDHVLRDPSDVRGPRALHPIFFGSFDWHSCVHTHWLLARLYRRMPTLAVAGRIRTLFDAQFTPAKVAAECAYLQSPASRGFERPYGWAWLLMLQGELVRHGSAEGRAWAAQLAPLAAVFVERFSSFLPLATYPIRSGAHANTAFALLLALDYAAADGQGALAERCAQSARRWYGEDRGCQAWEPSLDEFLSPALTEAALMAEVLTPAAFGAWFDAFLPEAAEGRPLTLCVPATVSDRSDGKIAHLDGLNLSRAWCWRRIVAALPGDHPLQHTASARIEAHLASALGQLDAHYMGEHWLASFALLALDPFSR